MDDRLQRVLAGQESVSPTAILGPDGRKTVAIIVDYARPPTMPRFPPSRRCSTFTAGLVKRAVRGSK